MKTRSKRSERVAADHLIAFASNVYQAIGVPKTQADLSADSLVQADLWGHSSHGVMRLPWYVARLRSGVVRSVPSIEIVADAGGVTVLDGHDSMGQVVAAEAMKRAINRSKEHGVGVVAVRNSNHFGTAMYFTLMGPASGCAALLSTNASPAMAPWGGLEKMVGTNPWSIAVPAGRNPPMVLDIASTAVARGKIYLARQRGDKIPVGWAIDAEGQDTTDPVAALAGLVLPMAGHKGYAIAVMMDVLSGVLTGSNFGSNVHGPYQAEQRSGCGHLIVALNISSFLAAADFDRRMELLISELKSATVAKGHDAIYYPGELEHQHDKTNRRDGLHLPEETMDKLEALGQEFAIPTQFFSALGSS